MLTEITLSNATNKTVLLNGQIRKFTGLDLAEATPIAKALQTSDGHRFTSADMKPDRSLEDLRDAMTNLDAIVVSEGYGEGTAPTVTPPQLEPVPAEPAAVRVSGDDAEQLASLIGKLAGGAVDAEQVRAIVADEMAKAETVQHKVVTLEYRAPAGVEKIDMAHPALAELLTWVNAGCHPLMVGPAGSGKTTAGMHIAKALGREFYFTGAVDNVFKLNGYMDANGNYVRTSFRDAYENGGVFLFDEIDASHPQAIVAFNAALANGHHDFPDGSVERHPDFVCLAAANTYGRGADRVYAGRNQLDGASLDRFVAVPGDYDTGLEFKLGEANPGWVEYVHNVRRAVEKTATKHVVGTRAIINGCKGLAAGLSRDRVEDATIWKGLSPDIVNKVKAAM